MNVLYPHLSTLFSLWTSLDVDACTINKKLESVIAELESLISQERKEKTLLSANIEDVLANIEYASNLLGVSLENMLNTSIVDDNFTLSPDMLTIYNSLNPTYPKERALIELDSRLSHEISIRQLHVTDWLSLIQKLCKELVIPFKFKETEEYLNQDLSWATIQLISCEVRDLQETRSSRLVKFDMLVKTIHYYWHILNYEKTNLDPIEVSLAALFENFPLDIDIYNITTQDAAFSYYEHPTNELKLSQDTLDILYTKNEALKSIFDQRYQLYHKSVIKVKAVWEEFNIPILERPTIPTSLSNKDMQTLKNIVDSIEPLVKSVFDKYIQQFKDQLIPLWDACLLSEIERKEFITSLYDKNTKLEIKAEVDNHMTYLKSIHYEGQALKALMKERKDLIQKMIDFEKTASDPKRLFQASFRLIEEEKWRNTCLPRLLQLDRALIKAIGEFEKLAGKPVMIGERRYLDTLLDEIADREANQTFFGFLSSEPVDRPVSKRMKNRPASVGSIGSIVVQNKKPQLKSRAVSAIITTSNNNMPKKIKPSQSMPLSKKQQQLQKKSSSSRKNSNTPDNTPNTTDLTNDDLYSTTAYINSNITLTKAFKPQRGGSQMSSMIPIASRTALTSTKSL
ncbi:microtubule associated protein-domain-containing protein [Mucor mucedo]|uniref:microtubule associated protein-domain-containing protein n=1 Tax=Mucor mucedo TaxID=29922 RepID=UPI00221E7DC8|nr:microtubule associated protein-domain-containing protein [Mucor mucedo]KAI7892611.1 microtubule associated protein-domain-containing protein [Mucor mucedo]